MARQIKIEQIDDLMKEAVQELVQKTTLQWTTLAKKATPVGETGNLRNDWKTDIGKFRGTIIKSYVAIEAFQHSRMIDAACGV